MKDHDDLAEKVAAALRAHGAFELCRSGWVCHCGETTTTPEAHLVAALLPLIREREAAAWDEGYHEGDEFPCANPYAGSEGK